MKIRQGIVLTALVTTASVSCAGIDEDDHETEQHTATPQQPETKALDQRQQLAASGRFLVPQSSGFTTATAAAMADALDIPRDIIISTQLVSPHEEAAMSVPNLGVIKPRKGSSFVVMSTGRNIANIPPEPGTDFAPLGPVGDVVTLRIQLTVPRGANRMSFAFNFLSAEAPDFVGSQYNDTFTAQITDDFGPRPVEGLPVSVNHRKFRPPSDALVAGTGYDLYVDDPSGVDELFGSGAYPPHMQLYLDTGVTGFQTVNVPVASGSVLTIEFSIRDLEDGFLDSAIILDDLEFSGIEVVDPNSATGLIDEFDGRVVSAPDAFDDLASRGSTVDAVAADGTTQVLLRTNVPGPGRVTFALGADDSGDGALSAIDPIAWGDSVDDVPVVEVAPGSYYAFALYRSPGAFNRGGDEAADTRQLDFSVDYEPTVGEGYRNEHTLDIVRPPVVVVHNIWSSCEAWANADIYADAEYPFNVSCANYSNSNGQSFDTNNRVVFDAIDGARKELRLTGTAVTQADVIGHGLGGLLVRRRIDETTYTRHTNFYEGDINRFIAMNTPHIGVRMADEIVAFRESAQAKGTWSGFNNTLKNQKIFIDDTTHNIAIDQMKTDSLIIGQLKETPVPSHVLVSRGGEDLIRTDAQGILANSGPGELPSNGNQLILYNLLEQQHPKQCRRCNAEGKPDGCCSMEEWEKLIYGPQSKLFCGDDHDLFATEWEQTGHLTSDAVHPASLFRLDKENTDSAHFKVQFDDAHNGRLAALLNTPIDDDKFAPLPKPSTIPPVNNCTASERTMMASDPARSLAEGSLAIVSPAPGTVVTPGSTVSVLVEASGGFQPEVVMISGEGGMLLVNSAPFVAQFPIAASAVGKISLTAIGFDAADGVAFAEEVPLIVSVPATLQSMAVLDGDAILPSPGSTRQLTVLGRYGDGIRRNITSAQSGTVYSSSDDGIATVSDDGLVIARAPGVAAIVARNAMAVTSISIEVEDGTLLPEALCRDVTVNADAACQAHASIDNGSFDPDELPQPLVLTQSPPGPYGPGAHAVTLTASDSAEIDTCQATITVVDNAPPVLVGCGDISVEAAPGLGGAYVNYEVTSSDNCIGSVPVACDVVSGAFFAMGESVPVTCEAADGAGNRSTCTFTVQVQEPTTCDASEPRSQDYWRTQCNYRAPDGTPPDPMLTADVLQHLLDGVEADIQAVCGPAELTCHTLNPDPYWDACEQACQHYAALLLNIASARAPSSCCTVQGTTSDTAVYVAELIAAGQCHDAISIASDFNVGCLFCGTEH